MPLECRKSFQSNRIKQQNDNFSVSDSKLGPPVSTETRTAPDPGEIGGKSPIFVQTPFCRLYPDPNPLFSRILSFLKVWIITIFTMKIPVSEVECEGWINSSTPALPDQHIRAAGQGKPGTLFLPYSRMQIKVGLPVMKNNVPKNLFSTLFFFTLTINSFEISQYSHR